MATDPRRQSSLALNRIYLAMLVIDFCKVLLSHNYPNLYKIDYGYLNNVEFSMYKILIILSFSLLASCSDKDVPSSDLVERQGIIYEINSSIPFTGSAVSYHKNALLKQKGKFKDGVENGFQEEYYDNGQLMKKENFKDGTKHGIQEKYYFNGQLKSKTNYKDGKMQQLRTEE
jgi:antitoxin component YwqK of YwqJK toxin-antitoxin module